MPEVQSTPIVTTSTAKLTAQQTQDLVTSITNIVGVSNGKAITDVRGLSFNVLPDGTSAPRLQYKP